MIFADRARAQHGHKHGHNHWHKHGHNHWRNHWHVLAATALASVVIGGFSPPLSAAPNNPTEAPTIVQIRDYNISPDAITISTGTKVLFHNAGNTKHRIVADDGSFDSLDLEPGVDFTTIAPAQGQLRIHCSIHPSMTATLNVVAGSVATTAAPAATTGAPPTHLAATGAGDTLLISVGLSCMGMGLISLFSHRRRQLRFAVLPAESAWLDVTVGQRHYDDIIAAKLLDPMRAKRTRG